ncbi:MAG: tetratricopeptide repeat protein [Xanthobacteraceae bacterium]
MPLDEFRIFISAVTSELGKARDAVAADLGARGLSVKVQREFRQEGDADTTLRKLNNYIASCAAVICIMGKRSGACPPAAAAAPFAAMLPPGIAGASYTQWEFFFARHHQRPRFIYIADQDYVADGPAAAECDIAGLQAAFIKYIVDEQGFDRAGFANVHQLRAEVLKQNWPLKLLRQPNNLPCASLGDLFKGREDFMATLHAALARARDGRATAVVGKALHGLGGVGKTRLAVEYALRHASEHSALLFVSAETPERLNAGLAALAGPDILDLPEKDAREDAVRIPAAIGWLEGHPGWLMILDNVDDRGAATAVEKLLARLRGGQVLITGRLTNFPAVIKMLRLDTLPLEEASAFLLERTQGLRAEASDDQARARELADELGGLALGLEQAGAYIATQRVIGFARYLSLWRERREKVLGWFDKTLMAYDHDVGLAATWATSVDQLKPAGRRLLERLAFFAAEPIPETLLDVAAPGDEADFDARDALADLFAYSLAAPAAADAKATGRAFAVHRLVQDFTRRELDETQRRKTLEQALGWVDAAFKGRPQDVRTWPVLDPLAPHAMAVAEHGDAANIAAPTGRLMGMLALLFDAKARLAEAEPLMRRALAIGEANYGPDHPAVALRLNNLATLLQATNRLAEAEPLMRRALAIDEASYGPDHPAVATDLNNLAQLLQDTNRPAEAEPLMRRALAIDEASYGPDHPDVATDLNNLAQLLQDTNRLVEAEPLMRRALAILEKSYGPNHPNVATNLNNLAQLLKDTNRLVEAEPLMRRALAIDEASYGPDHPNVARDLNNLAQLLKATDRLAEAEPLMRRALAIFEKSLGPEHPSTVTVRDNLAALRSQ